MECKVYKLGLTSFFLTLFTSKNKGKELLSEDSLLERKTSSKFTAKQVNNLFTQWFFAVSSISHWMEIVGWKKCGYNKGTIKALELHQWYFSGAFFLNWGQISLVFQIPLYLFFYFFILNFACWFQVQEHPSRIEHLWTLCFILVC